MNQNCNWPVQSLRELKLEWTTIPVPWKSDYHYPYDYIHWALPRYPMPFVCVFWWCNAWEICYIFKHISHASQIKAKKKKAWDDGIAPSVNEQYLLRILLYIAGPSRFLHFTDYFGLGLFHLTSSLLSRFWGRGGSGNYGLEKNQ